MTTRLLPADEWHRLPVDAEIPLTLDPARNAIVVTEQDGAITGCVVLMTVLHAEFLWVAPAYRGRVSVIRRLRDRIAADASAMGAPTVLIAALSRTMNAIACGLGAVRLPGDHYVWTMKEQAPCRQP